MNINILHIDDESDVQENVKDVLEGYEIGDNKLYVVDSCGFEDGMSKLAEKPYDLIILDLCVGKASVASDKIGSEIFEQIKQRAFIPVIFFTGLPEYVRDHTSGIVKVAGKAEGFEVLLEQIRILVDSGFIKLKEEVNSIVNEGLRAYFWNFIHPNSETIEELRQDDVSLKFLLLRRLGKTFSKEVSRIAAADPAFQVTSSHPMEFYIYPDIDGEYETGDLVKSKATGEYFAILTPSCDFVVRKDGTRKADVIFLASTKEFKTIPDFTKYEGLQAGIDKIIEDKKTPSKDDYGQLKSSLNVLKDWMKNKKNDRYFFLPKTFFLPAILIDFQLTKTVSYDDLESNYVPVASLDDPISQAVQSSYTRYFSRVGYQDLDVDYALDQIIS